MLPPRFPNSGIRAKVFVRKISLKLRVMILNRVESFYALLLYFRSEGSEEEGRLAMASPPPAARAVACTGDRSCRGSARVRRHRPPTRCRSRAAAPTQGNDDGAVRVREEG
ncbi:hypothetical protein BHE74_00044701 [Ensete ventricosum]|uniref:Uncharacterized protein n=1 Tax=Ensete ventricosum TaxID=4639 RepID=A0A444D6W1_ENSVE|nr:hypothetical protein GW17_00043676 [Ensete ventricosum]RWW49172.1 hypothetical protein BHE74_00044701 [Ensete ventricosum]RZR75177.1 hypothetical protein BHM03_00051110 [Ensete ventricosum]